MTEATSTGSEAAPTGIEATATVAGFTSTGSRFILTECYANAFDSLANTSMIGIVLTRSG